MDLKDVSKVEKFADEMLKNKDAAGFVDAIRGDENGAVHTILAKSYGDNSAWGSDK